MCFEHVTMTAPTNRESDKFMLRLPDGMRERLKDEAAKNGRSMNAEIVHHLEEALASAARRRLPGVPVGPAQMEAIVQAADTLSRLILAAEESHKQTGE